MAYATHIDGVDARGYEIDIMLELASWREYVTPDQAAAGASPYALLTAYKRLAKMVVKGFLHMYVHDDLQTVVYELTDYGVEFIQYYLELQNER